MKKLLYAVLTAVIYAIMFLAYIMIQGSDFKRAQGIILIVFLAYIVGTPFAIYEAIAEYRERNYHGVD